MMYYNQDPVDIHYVITMFACHLTAVTVLGLLLSVLMNKMVVDYVIKKGNLCIYLYSDYYTTLYFSDSSSPDSVIGTSILSYSSSSLKSNMAKY